MLLGNKNKKFANLLCPLVLHIHSCHCETYVNIQWVYTYRCPVLKTTLKIDLYQHISIKNYRR